ncbi:B12-binding domain-containing radical SAM protein [Thermodesulfobacteriota bacterium]
MRIKLFHPPRIYGINPNTGIIPDNVIPPLMPPLAIPVLKSYLERNGVEAASDDLFIKVWHRNYFGTHPGEEIDLLPFNDRERVFAYIDGGVDKELARYGRLLTDMIDIGGYDIFGISIVEDVSFSTFGATLVIAKFIKEATGKPIVVGGRLKKQHGIDLLNTGLIDYMVLGERGEVPLLKLLQHLQGKGAIEDVPCLIYRDGAEIKDTFYRVFMTFEFPNFDGLPLDMYRYFHGRMPGQEHLADYDPDTQGLLILPYYFVNGCQCNCTFCKESQNRRFRVKRAREVAADLARLSERYNTRYFFFINSNVNPSLKYMVQLCRSFKEYGLDIRWSDCATFKHLDEAVLEQMREAGATRLIYGIESGSQNMISAIEKGFTLDHAQRIIDEAHQVGIWNEVELIAGLPHETQQDINATLRFINRNTDNIQLFHLNKFYLVENSSYYLNADQYGLSGIKPNMKSLLDTRFFKFRFDETEGLHWKQKVQQINASYDAVDAHRRKINTFVEIYPLHYLYEKYKTKEAVLANLNR